MNWKKITRIWQYCQRFATGYFSDIRRHVCYSLAYQNKKKLGKDSLRCSIMLLNHQLEKAQTYPRQKQNYGREKILQLLSLLENYDTKLGADDLFDTSLGVLQSHFANPYAYKDNELRQRFDRLRLNRQSVPIACRGGILEFDSSRLQTWNELGAFLNSRRSCRHFSSKIIPDEEIVSAVRLAMTAPSACNRQPIRIHCYKNKEQIRKIIEAQQSDIEWCLEADRLIIVTANDYYYRDYLERNQKMFDAGLFAMLLNLALHNRHIGSCFKMAQKDTKIDLETKHLANINPQEDICVLMLLGYYPEHPFVVARSFRIDIEHVLTIHS